MTKTKRPYADPTSKRRNVTVNDDNWKALKEIGHGNASEGIREAVRIAEGVKQQRGTLGQPNT